MMRWPSCARQIAWDVSFLLIYLSSAINFAIYMLTGAKFRKAFLDTIFRREQAEPSLAYMRTVQTRQRPSAAQINIITPV